MIHKTMKAWVLTEPGKLELQTVPVPQPGRNQVLVKIDRACICNGSDPGIFHGHEAYETPLIFGHEASGRIVDRGDDITEFSIGERICWWFEAGAFAEYQVITPENIAAFPVPESVSRAEAPVIELVLAACRALMEIPPETYGRQLLICGLGPSGLILAQYARAIGYEKITGWDLYESRRRLAMELGVDEVYNPEAITGEKAEAMEKADVGVMMMGDDCLPGEPTAAHFFKCIRPGGLAVSYGHPENGRRFSPYVFQSRCLSMRGPVNDMEVIRKKGKEIMELLDKGKIRIRPLITHEISFKDFLPAFQNVLEHPEEQIKVILHWDEDVEGEKEHV